MAACAFLGVDVVWVVIFLLPFFNVSFLERIVARNPKVFPFAHGFGHPYEPRSGNGNVVQRDK